MKIEKTNGLYRKKRLTTISRVPFLVWLPAVLIISSIVILFSLRIALVNDEQIPDQPVVRKASWRIAAVGDIACNPDNPNFNSGLGLVDTCQMKAVGEALERERLDAVFLLGDIQYTTGKFEDFEKSFVPYFREINAPLYVAPGNHDYGNGTIQGGDLSGYKKAFDQYFPNATYEKEGKTYYDFNLGSWSIYALDSNCQYVGGCDVGSPQYNWLTSKVSSEITCSIALWHHPLFTSGPHKSDSDILDRRPFWTALQSVGTDIVLNGHDHHYERFAPMLSDGTVSQEGIRQFISGAGGYSVRKVGEPFANGQEKVVDDQFGYLYMELFAGRYEWQYKTVDGVILDEGSESCR
jgi:acid phosphatase type 7